jgi:hypothetical protein
VTSRGSWCAFSCSVAIAASLLGCSATTTAVASADGRETYSIECIKIHDCWAAAQRACGGRYETVLTTHNQIPESELPGFNAVTDSHTHSHHFDRPSMPSNVPVGGPGIESDAPMPLAEVIVVCSGVS